MLVKVLVFFVVCTSEGSWRIVGWLNGVNKESSGQISSPSDSANDQ